MASSEVDLRKIIGIYRSGIMNRDETDFQVLRYENTNIKLFPIRRECSFCELRVSLKRNYNCKEEFIVASVFEEEFPKETNISISWEHLGLESCSDSDLEVFYSELHTEISALPKISKVRYSKRVTTNSDFDWVFLEDESNYYSLFWRNSQSKGLKLSA